MTTNLEVLSSCESVSLCREAALLVLSRLRWLAERAEPGDRPLTQLFEVLAVDVKKNLDEISKLDGPALMPGLLDNETARQAARGFLPSLSKTVGGSSLNRESGFHMAESILKDLSGFYAALVRQSSDEKSRELLRRSRQVVEARLDYLRHVVL